MGLLWPKHRTRHLALLYLIQLASTYSSSLFRSLCRAFLPSRRWRTPTQLDFVCKLTEGALNPLIQIIDKDSKQDQIQNGALENTTLDWLPAGFNSIHHHSLCSAIQTVLYPGKSAPIQTTGGQFLQEDAEGNVVKSLMIIQVDNIHSLSLIY